MVYITHIRIMGGDGVEHITRVRWEQPSHGTARECSLAQMVEFIRDGNDVFVLDAKVVVVNGNPPYLRTVADGRESNNLLSLPRF